MFISSIAVMIMLGMSYSSGDNNSAIVLFVVNGNVSVPNVTFTEWLPFTKILVDGGDFQGFLK